MPEKDVLFSVTLPDGTKTTLNQEQYTQAQDKLFSKFPDAQVARVQSYVGDDDDQNDTDSYQIQLPDGTSTTLNETQFAGSRKKLMEKYPDAQIARISDMTDRYWRPKLEEAQAALKAFNEQNGGAISTYEENLRNAVDAPRSANWDTPARQYVREHQSEYETLKQQRDALGKAVYNNPIISRGRKQAYEGAMALRDEYLKLAEQAQTGEERRDYKRAAKLQGDAAELYSAPGMYDEYSGGVNGFSKYIQDYGKGMLNTASDRDFWFRGLTQIARDFDLYGIRKKVQDEEHRTGRELTERDFDRILTKSEKAELLSFYNLARAQSDDAVGRASDLASAFKAGQSSVESLGFMAEFLLSQGMANVAGKAMSASANGLTRWMGQALMSEKALNRAVNMGVTTIPQMSKAGKIGTELARPMVQGLWHTGTQLSTLSNIATMMNETNDEGELNSVGRGIWLGLADSFVENWSESLGNTMDKGFERGLEWAGNKLGASAIGKSSFGRMARWAYNSNFNQTLKEAGFNGFIGEMLEEWAGNAVRLGTGLMDKDEFKQFASVEQQLEMAASFAPMSLFGLGGNLVSVERHKKEYSRLADQVKGILMKDGVSQAEIDDLFNTKFDTGEDIAKKLAPYAQKVLNSGSDTAREDYATILQLAQETGVNSFNEAMEEMKAQGRRNEVRDAIASKTGQFWQDYGPLEEGGEPVEAVHVVRYADGTRKYIVGGTEQSPNGVRMFATVDQDGNKGFINDLEIKNGLEDGTITANEEMGLNEYLQEQVDAVDKNVEAQRMQKEAAEQLNAIRARIAENPSFNMGTPEQPINATVVHGTENNAGATVMIDRGEGGVFESQLSWKEIGEYLGTPIDVKTDEQLKEEAAIAQQKAIERKDKYNKIPVGSQIVVTMPGAEGDEQVPYRFAKAIYDENEDSVRVYVADENGNIMTNQNGEEVWFPEEMIPGLEAQADEAIQQAAAPVVAAEEEQIEDKVEAPVQKYTNADGKVNQTAFFKNEPEEWAKWNDARRNDGGANSKERLAASISELEKEINELNKKKAATANPDDAEAIEEKVNELAKRYASLKSIYDQYIAIEQAAKAAEDEAKRAEFEAAAKKKKEEEQRKAAKIQDDLKEDASFVELAENYAAQKKTYGDTDTYNVGGRKFKGRWVVAEATTPKPSHNPLADFAPTPGYPIGKAGNSNHYDKDKRAQEITREMSNPFDERAVQEPVVVTKHGVVLSGNGRTQARLLAAQQDTDADYEQYIKEHANKWGFTAEQISEYENPMLYFELEEDVEYTAALFDAFNRSTSKQQSATETAAKVAQMSSEELVMRLDRLFREVGDNLDNLYKNPEKVNDLLNMLQGAGIFNANERARYVDEYGNLSGAGEDLVESVLFGTIFDTSDDAVRAAMNDKAVRRAVTFAFPTLMRLRNLRGEFTLINELTEAVSLVSAAKAANGGKAENAIIDYMLQGDIFSGETPVVKATVQLLAHVLNDSKYGALRSVLNQYIERAEAANYGQAIFTDEGGIEVETKERILRDVLAHNKINIETYGNTAPAGQHGVSADGEVRSSSGEQGSSGNGTDTAGEADTQGVQGEGNPSSPVDPLQVAKEQAEKARLLKKLQKRIDKWTKFLGKGAFEIATGIEDIQKIEDEATRNQILQRQQQYGDVEGWFANGKAVIYLPNIPDQRTLDRKIMHEVVAHKGIKGLFEGKGKGEWDKFLDWTWGNLMNDAVRSKYLNYPGVVELKDLSARQRAAADEFLAHCAENENAVIGELDETFWDRLVEAVKNFLNDAMGEDVFQPEDAGWFGDLLKQAAQSVQQETAAQEEEGGTLFSIQGLPDYSEQDVANLVSEHIKEALPVDNDEFSVVDIRVIGSRANGTAKKDSDLDVLVQYDGTMREDDAFNALNEEPLEIDGIRVDINPINTKKSGTADEWIKLHPKEVDTIPNEMEEGNVLFSVDDKHLVGIHNISERKLKSAIRIGGLANPSLAVIDVDNMIHEDYGDISLIAPSSLIDTRKGRNAGTYNGDAWTPTYPGVRKQMSDKGWDKFYDQVRVLPEPFSHQVRNDWREYLDDDRMGRSLKWWFLQDTGRNPDTVYNTSNLSEEDKELVRSFSGKKIFGTDEDASKAIEMFRRLADPEDVERAGRKIEIKEGRSGRYRDWAIARNEDIDSWGIFTAPVVDFIEELQRQVRYEGTIAEQSTYQSADDFVRDNNLDGEFQQWLQDKEKEFGTKEVLFAGWTQDGDRKYVPNTVENASRLMNKEPDQNAYGNGGLSATRSLLLERMDTLEEIRKNRGQLADIRGYASETPEYEAAQSNWFNVIEALANMQKISDNQFSNIDYAEARLQEAIQERNPIAYLNKEYRYNLSEDGEFADALKASLSEIKNLPAKYFETKFNRPVYLNEFAAAVIPTDTSKGVREELERAGVPVYEYDSKQEGSRQEAVLQASQVDGVRFSVGDYQSGEAQEQYRQQLENTPEFKEWFKGSKVVDENGNPLVVYRGATFDPLAMADGLGVIKPQAYFSPSEEYARRYGPWTRSYYLNIQNPFDIRNKKALEIYKKMLPDGYVIAKTGSGAADWAEFGAAIDIDSLMDNHPEYDGLILDEGGDPDGNGGVTSRGVSYIPLRGGAQVKSAEANNGQFSSENPDVRFSVTPEQDDEYMKAVEDGDMEKAQQMVDDAAKAAGYTVKGYHGTILRQYDTEYIEAPQEKPFTVFHTDNQMGAHFGYSRRQAENRARDLDREDAGWHDNEYIYDTWLKLDNPALIDDIRNFNDFQRVRDNLIENEVITEDEARYVWNNKSITDLLKSKGYDGLVYTNDYEGRGPSYVVFDANQIKSADPVVRDDAGNVVPLSERFNPASNDIRFSIRRYHDFLTAQQENKVPGKEYPEDPESDVRFSLSKNNRATIKTWLKKRADLTDDQRSAVMDYLDQMNNPTLQLATARWFSQGAIRIPEDMDKVEQAVSVAGKAKVDPLQYSSPMELLDAHAGFQASEKRINPDDVHTLHKVAEYPEQGVVIYDVDPSQESRENMRKIINTHFGKEASPWCLLQGDGNGNLTSDSERYWKHYNGYKKQVAFKDGKLLAFSANDNSRRVWWDRQDKPHAGIPITMKMPGDELGRSATYEYNPETREIGNPTDIHKGNKQNGLYELWSDEGIQIVRANYKDGKLDGLCERWHRSTGKRWITETLKNGRNVGDYTEWWPEGSIKQVAHFDEDGFKIGDWVRYHENGKKAKEEHFDAGLHEGVEIYWNSNGDMIARVSYKNGKTDGLYERWFGKDMPEVRIEYKNGRPHGESLQWWATGNILRRTHYVEGIEVGTREEWSESGNPSRIVHYNEKGEKNGVEIEFYDLAGGRHPVGHIGRWVNGEAEGLQEYFYDNGNHERREMWKNGKREGLSEHFWKEGVLRERANYKNNERHGITETFESITGNILSRSLWEDGNIIENLSIHDSEESTENNARLSIVTDEKELERLEKEPTVTLYRAMELVDGKLYPPMSQKVPNAKEDKGKKMQLREGVVLGMWQKSDEDPSKAYQKEPDGPWYYDLKKRGKKSDVNGVLYNPYLHLSASPLNDQFTSASTRPNLVIVACEVPISELTSGYKAEKANDSVGAKDWHSGTVTAQLGEGRQVVLSRWAKIGRIVPDAEVAAMVAPQLVEKGIVVPANVVTPSLRAALEQRGVKVAEPQSDVKFSIQNRVFRAQDRKPGEAPDKYAMRLAYTYDNVYHKGAVGWEQPQPAPKEGKLKNADMVYSKTSKKITIFVRNEMPSVSEMEMLFFHESVHAWIDKLSEDDKKTFVEAYNAAPFVFDETREQAYKDLERRGYTEEERPEEYITYTLSQAMQIGKVGTILDVISEEGGNILNDILKNIDYNVEQETIRRTAGEGSRDSGQGNFGESGERAGMRNALAERGGVEEENSPRFAVANEHEAVFISNAMNAVRGIPMQKATPQQWLKMIESRGGLKAGEDKWIGLSDWLKASDAKTLTKQEVEDYIAENQINIKEVRYSEEGQWDWTLRYQEEYQQLFDEAPFEEDSEDYAFEKMVEKYGEDFEKVFESDGYNLFARTDEEGNEYAYPELAERFFGDKPIESTRLAYTSEGLANKREVALTVPTIRPWNKNDEIHFGDAGEGRAIAWARFGDAVKAADDENVENAKKELEKANEEYHEYRSSLLNKYNVTRLSDLLLVGTDEEKAERQRLAKIADEKFKALEDLTMGTGGNRVLFIDEIQSKRHQEGREHGYMTEEAAAAKKAAGERLQKAEKSLNSYRQAVADLIGTPLYLEAISLMSLLSSKAEKPGISDEEKANYLKYRQQLSKRLAERNEAIEEARRLDTDAVPDAPFEKNWHELTLKRMLRLAADEGYDYVAWTRGEQQAERYNLGEVVDYITRVKPAFDDELAFELVPPRGGVPMYIMTDKEGNVQSVRELPEGGKTLTDYVGKDLASKMLAMEIDDDIDAKEYHVGAEGMRGFYDEILPRYMDKYLKKWGVKTEDLLVNAGGLIYDAHSVKVTPEMRESVKQGQVMFSVANDNQEMFISNAARAVETIKMERATPEQWLAMLEKAGGLKAGEDKWIGLSDWLKSQDKKTISKQEIVDYVNEHKIRIEESRYAGDPEIVMQDDISERIGRGNSLQQIQDQIYTELRLAGDELEGWDQSEIDNWLTEQMVERYGDDFTLGYNITDGEVSYNTDDYSVDDFVENTFDGEDVKPINRTRYGITTEGLKNKREIALTIPTVEPWNETDMIHFGDAGNGRAIAWIRFGDAVRGNGERVLFIDEIQSKRHQEGREKGYRDYKEAQAKAQELGKKHKDLFSDLQEVSRQLAEQQEVVAEEAGRRGLLTDDGKIAPGKMDDFRRLEEEDEKLQSLHKKWREIYKERQAVDLEMEELRNQFANGIPGAPFEKNWHELAMKRMLRLAAEEGYDYVAWTTGEQQAERYNLSQAVSEIAVKADNDGKYRVVIEDKYGTELEDYRGSGKVMTAEELSQLVGKELATRLITGAEASRGLEWKDGQKYNPEYFTIKGEDLNIGGEGMKGFYDDILPRFMNKYGKKWNAQTEDKLVQAGDNYYTVHTVPVTDEMKESVMQGQVMFSVREAEKAREDGIGGVIGQDNVRDFYMDLYGAMAPEMRKGIADKAMDGNMNFVEAMAEYVSGVAAKGYDKDDTGLLLVAESLLNSYAEDYINPNAAQYILWRGNHGVDENDLLSVASDRFMWNYLKVEDYPDNPDDTPDGPGKGSIEEAREETDTNPSDAQKEAGNYKHGHVSIDGYNISLENPKGSVRSGKDASGKEWSVTMNNDYGYIRLTKGVDGDHIDVFLSDNPEQGDVYVVDQVDPKTGEFDEHKVMYGFNSIDEAREAYLANYSEGWKGLGSITGVTKDEFKKWIDSSHRKTKPFADYKSVRFSVAENVEKAEGEAAYAVDAAKEKLAAEKKELKDLLTVAKAMGLQKEYDKKTVEAVTNLAKGLLKDQYVEEMSRREVSRLLGIIRTSVGKSPKTIKKNVDAIVEMVIEHLLNREKKGLADMTKTTGSKTNATGVEIAGELDAQGQKTLKAFKDGIKMELGDVDDSDEMNTLYGRRARLQSKLESNDDAIRKDAEAENAGLALAIDYKEAVESLLDEEASLALDLKELDEALAAGEISKTDHKEAVEATHDAIRENHIDQVQAYRDFRRKLQEMTSKSSDAKKAFMEREKERIEAIHHLANSDMQGKSASKDKTPTFKDKLANSAVVRFFAAPLHTFDQMLRLFGSKSVEGKGYLFNKFMGDWQEATEKAYLGQRDAKEELDKKASEVFGREMKWEELYDEERKMPKVTVKWWDDGKMTEHELTQGQLLYIYMVNKMADGRMKLRKMGIDEEHVEAIKARMDKRFLKLADWLQEEYLVERRNKYNEVHERLFGAPMAAIENYFPLKINKRDLTKNEDIAAPDIESLPSTTTGSIIKRRRNSKALDLLNADAFAVTLDHINQMEEWAAFAEFNKDVNALLSYKRFRNQVQNMASVYGSGTKLWNNFKDVARVAGNAYHPAVNRNQLDSTAVNIAKGVTFAKISFRVYTAMKQLLSMPAFVADANIVKLAANIATPWTSWNWAMENLPVFQKRWKSRIAGDTRLMDTEVDWRLYRERLYKQLSKWGMSPNAFVDAVTVAIGAHSIYQTKFDQYVKEGFSEEEADKKAKKDATVSYNETQQSNETAFVSPVQLDRTVFSTAITVFRNSSMGFQRQLHDALRNLGHLMTKGYKKQSIEFMQKQLEREGLTAEQAKAAAERRYNNALWHNATRVATFGFLVQFAWNLGGSLAYLLFGDDDDEKEKMLREAFIHGLIGGPIEGLAGGNVLSEALDMVARGESLRDYDPTLLPIISDMKRTYSMMSYDPVAGCNELVNLAIQAGIGVNPQTLEDAVVAIIDACDGDLGTSREAMLLIMRVLQVPQSQIDQIYIDELGMTADKARKMTPKQMAKRYADYKLMRNAGKMTPLYSGEMKEKRLGNYEKSFNKKVKERKELKKK